MALPRLMRQHATIVCLCLFALISLSFAASSTHSQTVYTSVPSSSSVVMIDSSTNKVVGSIAIPPATPGGAPSAPSFIALTPDAKFLYVLDTQPQVKFPAPPSAMDIIDTATNTVISTIPIEFVSSGLTTGGCPNEIGFSPDGLKGYVTDRCSGFLSIIDTKTLSLTTALTNVAFSSSAGLAVGPDGSKVYLGLSRGLGIYDTSAHTLTTLPLTTTGFPTPVFELAATSDGTQVFVTNGAPIYVFDTTALTFTLVSGTGPVCTPGGINITPDGKSAFEGDMECGNLINQIDISTDVASFFNLLDPRSATPQYFAFTADSQRAYAACGYDSGLAPSGNVQVFDVNTHASIAVIPVGPRSAFGIAIMPPGATTTTTTLSSSTNSSIFGQQVSFTATVSPSVSSVLTPSGTVTFSDGATVLGSATLVSGSAVFSTTSLSGGTHTITASYGGDTNFQASSSAAQSVVVSQSSTSLAFTSSASSSVFGQAVTLTATASAVAPGAGTPTGTVTFNATPGGGGASTTIGSTQLSNGQAVANSSPLPPGSYVLVASYSGDSDFTSVQSSSQLLTVNKANASVILASSANLSVFGQAITLTATVGAVAPGSGTPTGTVVFTATSQGGGVTTTIGSVQLSNGQAVVVSSSLPPGSYAVVANYSGDADFNSPQAASLPLAITKANTSVVLTSSANPSVFGQTVTLTATVGAVAPSSGTPSGTVTFVDSATNSTVGTAALISGVARLTTLSLPPGAHVLLAQYPGDLNFTGNNSLGLTQTVSKASALLLLSSSANPSQIGQSVTFTVNASPVAPSSGVASGTITFLDGSTTLGTATLTSGLATFTTSSLAVGPHSIITTYAGDQNFAASTSAPLTQTVTQVRTSTTTTLSSSANPSLEGQTVTFTAAVTPASGSTVPTGSVNFFDGGTSLGSASLSGSGVASLIVPQFGFSAAPMPHSVTAQYSGDLTFTGSTSTALTQTVNPVATSVSLVWSPSPANTTQQPTFTVTVTLAAPLASQEGGVVTVQSNSPFPGTCTVAAADFGTNLSAKCGPVTTFVPPGTSTWTATFQPSSPYYAPSTITSTEVVNPANGTEVLVTNSPGQNTLVVGASVTVTAVILTPSLTANYVLLLQGIPGTVTFQVDGGPGIVQPASYSSSNLLGLGPGLIANTTLSSGPGTSLPVGTHTITATYNCPPNACAMAGISSSFTDFVNKAPTVTTLTATPGTSLLGSPVQLSTTVAANLTSVGTPTGSVTFSVANTPLGTVPLVPGSGPNTASAVFTTSSLPGGVHAITASYSGDANYSASFTNFIEIVNNTPAGTNVPVQPVDPGTGTAPVTMSFASVSQQGITSLTITSSGPAPQSGFQIGNPPVYYNLATTATYAGNISICINYAGVNFTQPPQLFHFANGAWVNITTSVNAPAMTVCGLSPSLSPFALFQPTPLATTTAITAPGIKYGTPGSVTISVGSSNGAATGNVLLSVDGGTATAAALVNGSATFGVGILAVGSHSLSASFPAQGNFLASIASGTLTVAPETTSLTITFAPASIPVGQSTTATITLTAPDMVVPIDPSVLVPITLTSPIVSDILSNGGVCTPVPSTAPGVASCTVTVTSVEPNGRTLNASFAGSAALLTSSGTGDLIVTAPLQSQNACIQSDFRNVAVAGGNTIWFNSIFKVRELDGPRQRINISFYNSSFQFQYKDAGGNLVSVNQSLPDAHIAIDPSVSVASASFDSANNVWITTIPWDPDDSSFLTGMPWIVPSGGLPADVEPVTVCGTFASDNAGMDIGWRWAAAAYSSFSTDNSVLGVNPMDNDHDNSAQNHDQAGTPENFEQFVIPGARGRGGKNYTGTYSGSKEIE
jgi:Bacterial Ig-like domain (group 3)